MSDLFGMTSNYKIVIDKEIKNANNGQTKHWGTSHRERQQWMNALRQSYIVESNGAEMPTTDYLECASPCYKQGLLITRHLGKNQRFFDPDSVLRGNAKQLVDGLIEMGVAKDDSVKYLLFVIGLQSDADREIGPYTTVEVFS
jgi:hypothetical protein